MPARALALSLPCGPPFPALCCLLQKEAAESAAKASVAAQQQLDRVRADALASVEQAQSEARTAVAEARAEADSLRAAHQATEAALKQAEERAAQDVSAMQSAMQEAADELQQAKFASQLAAKEAAEARAAARNAAEAAAAAQSAGQDVGVQVSISADAVAVQTSDDPWPVIPPASPSKSAALSTVTESTTMTEADSTPSEAELAPETLNDVRSSYQMHAW